MSRSNCGAAEEKTDTASDGRVVLEKMERSHLSAVLAIDEQVYPQPWSPSLWRQEVEFGETRRYTAALIGDKLVGFSGLMLLAGTGHVSTIAVDPPQQRAGVATALMKGLFADAHEADLEALTLEVRVSNNPARELYRRFGFAPSGIRPNYYSDTNEDALIMWCHDLSIETHGASAH
jgi:ribosomal-protein-alanine N-acetyltransferase